MKSQLKRVGIQMSRLVGSGPKSKATSLTKYQKDEKEDAEPAETFRLAQATGGHIPSHIYLSTVV